MKGSQFAPLHAVIGWFVRVFSHLTVTFIVFSPIFTMATDPGCRVVFITVRPFPAMAVPVGTLTFNEVSDNVNANNNNPTPDPGTGGGDDAGE